MTRVGLPACDQSTRLRGLAKGRRTIPSTRSRCCLMLARSPTAPGQLCQIGRARLALPGSKALLHSTSVASRPIEAAACRKQHDRCIAPDRCGKPPVFGKQDAMLFGAPCGDCAVGESANSNDSVVPARPQPSAEPMQHLVAQKPRHQGPLNTSPRAYITVMGSRLLSIHKSDRNRHPDRHASPPCPSNKPGARLGNGLVTPVLQPVF
jgi:hypothetical protein